MDESIELVAIHTINSRVPPGDIFEVDTLEEAESLVERGAARWPDESDPERFEEEEEEDEETELPEDIPARLELLAAGFESLEAVGAISDFSAIQGIGASKAAALEQYLGLDEE